MVEGLGVLVTGAGGGAGRIIAERFADLGAVVAVCDQDPSALAALRAARPGIAAIETDLGDPEAVGALFNELPGRIGCLDILVNNVGIAGPTAAAEDIDLGDWNAVMAVNLTSHFLCAQGAIRQMKPHRRGSIVNIASSSATVGLPMRLAYVVSKAAVLSLTRNLARELGPFGIRVNAVLPGGIKGARVDRVIREKATALGITECSYRERMLRFTSLRTLVTAEDVAAMVVFLGSSDAERVSGQAIGVDGHVEYEE